jgi:transposase-like protein
LNVRECTLPAETPEQVPEVVVDKKVRKKHHHLECPRCGGNYLKRKRRQSFLERRVFSLFGYYPWKCSMCGGSFQLKKRGLSLRHQKPDADAAASGA